MSKLLHAVRGPVFYLIRDPIDYKWPEGATLKSDVPDDAPYRYHRDGMLVFEAGTGIIAGCGTTIDMARQFPSAKIIRWFDDGDRHLICPGFIDCHVHYPQVHMMGAYGEELLTWLKKYTFPTEAEFKDPKHARKVAELFLDDALQSGTTTAMVFCTRHKCSVDEFFEASKRLRLRMIAGRVMMDTNCPDELRDASAQESYDESKELIDKWHGVDRLLYAVTPRFAPTSSREQLQLAARLLKEHPTVYLHTHLAENHSESEWVANLFPESTSYFDVYNRFGLAGPRSVFAHSINLTQADWDNMGRLDCAAVPCPLSNQFLGSGFFNYGAALKSNVRVALGTDVGAGTSLSLLRVQLSAYNSTKLMATSVAKNLSLAGVDGQRGSTELDLALKVPREQSIKVVSPLRLWYLATLAGAKALRLDKMLGSFEPGKEADFIVLDTHATAVMETRMKRAETMEEKLFALIAMGGTNSVAATYILGECVFQRRSAHL